MARIFDGSFSNYLDCGDPASAQFTGEDLTVMCFAKPASISADRILVAKWGVATNQHEWQLQFDTSANLFAGSVKSTGTATSVITCGGPAGVKVGVWYHCCLRQQDTSRPVHNIDFFTNGVLGQRNGSLRLFTDSGNNLLIGRRTDTTNSAWSGSLAHVAVWNYPLPDATILAIAQGVLLPNQVMPQFLMGYYPLNGYTSERDLSGRNQTAVMTGTVGYDNNDPYISRFIIPFADVPVLNTEAATVILDLSVESADAGPISDAGTVLLDLVPSSTDIYEHQVILDSATVYLDMTVLGGECYSRFHFTGEGEADTRWSVTDATAKWVADVETRWSVTIEVQPGCH